jgi:signal transduction histidine kinase
MADGGAHDEARSAASARDLVFALCHELGNLLAAARLEAGLLAADAGAAELATAAERIAEWSARAGSLLALVRPLLAPEAVLLLAADPLDVLDGLRSGLDESSDSRVVIALKSAAQLPGVSLAPELLHHLLLTAIYCGLEAAAPEGRVRVAAEAEGDSVAFVVEDEGGFGAADRAPELRGRPLTHEIARVLLAGLGGRFEAVRSAGRTRVAFAFPVAAGLA